MIVCACDCVPVSVCALYKRETDFATIAFYWCLRTSPITPDPEAEETRPERNLTEATESLCRKKKHIDEPRPQPHTYPLETTIVFNFCFWTPERHGIFLHCFFFFFYLLSAGRHHLMYVWLWFCWRLQLAPPLPTIFHFIRFVSTNYDNTTWTRHNYTFSCWRVSLLLRIVYLDWKRWNNNAESTFLLANKFVYKRW